MERPIRFEHTRFLGDKRTQLVYDLDEWQDEAVIEEIVAAETGLCFGPDTLAEARNRGYTLATPGKTRRHRKPRAYQQASWRAVSRAVVNDSPAT